ncbi:molybdopterin dehydrogenase [Clostridium sp. OF09-36]|uniref:FAD binding domain-containing protein n=1 Tax=Clostridium sp. OF09-36 TaxID=2292310 RepID=UPI000E4EBBC3|nr:FAD binding domain-containing protein [Clostridium sp. OF09-36]RHV89805.1 molybdopterin dehydrogenase [Clostridium sp. OF09-36]
MFHAKEYVKAESLEQAYALNQKKSNVLVGGMMWLKMGNGNRNTVIDLSGLGLGQIEETEEEFRIGCMCSLRDLELHERLNQYFGGVFRECTRWIVGTQFRNGATVGGSIFGRFGFSDILTCMMVLDTYVELYKGGTVSLEEFAKMKYERDILVRIIIKKDGRKAAYVSQRRSKTDFPLIAVAAAKKDDMWYLSVGARPSKAALVVRPVQTGCELSEQAKEAVSQFSFGSNLRGSADYRKSLAEIYVRRLMEALNGEEA